MRNPGLLLTRAEAATRLRICKRTVDRYIRLHGIPAIRIGSRVMIGAKALDKWLFARPPLVPRRKKAEAATAPSADSV